MKRRDKGLYNSYLMYSFPLFPFKVPLIKDISKEASKRLKWFDYYYSHDKNASLTCRYFGICRDTFYKWKNRYNKNNLSTLENLSKAPIKRRKRMITLEQEDRRFLLSGRHNFYFLGRAKEIYLYRYR